jgi:uracil-DNA glycosylase
MSIFLSTTDYEIPNWNEKFPDCKIDFNNIQHGITKWGWNNMFQELFKDKRMKDITKTLETLMLTNTKIFPYPDLLFNSFVLTNIEKLKVVFIGQDPYYMADIENDIEIPQAMGLSFSVPTGLTIPSSLKNIYNNMKKFNVIKNIPSHGNLELWAVQGCLMLNTSLTVIEGDKNKNCHKKMWKWFTDYIIKYISDNCEGIIFVLWGANALEKSKVINFDKHDAIISSHPSGLSCNKKLNNYPSFNEVNHFGEINKKLRDLKKVEIVWA